MLRRLMSCTVVFASALLSTGLDAAELVPLAELDPTMVRQREQVVVPGEVLPGIQEAPMVFTRFLPQAYHDQASASLRGNHPQLQVVVDRRSGRLGEARYSLLAYRNPIADARYQLSACVVRGERAWRLELAIDEARFDAGLLLMLSRIHQYGLRAEHRP